MAVVLPPVTRNAYTISLLAVVVPLVLAINGTHLWSHLKNYQSPVTQRYCIRILLIVPVYVALALISIVISVEHQWLPDLLRVAYEAFTIYNFMALMLQFVGGPTMLVDLWESERRYLTGTWKTSTCCLGTIKLDGLFLRRIVQCIIQFVIVRVLFAITVPLLIQCKWYDEGHIKFNKGFLYVTAIHNLSLAIALYALLLFFLGTRHYLRPFSPVLKFALIKAIIFVSFWQKIALQVLAASKLVNPADSYSRDDMMVQWNCFLIILECLPLAILLRYAFGVWAASYDTEYGSWRMLVKHGDPKLPNMFPGENSSSKGENFVPKPMAALSHAVNARDVLEHAYTTFSEHYAKYRYMSLELSQREAASNSPMFQSPAGNTPGQGHMRGTPLWFNSPVPPISPFKAKRSPECPNVNETSSASASTSASASASASASKGLRPPPSDASGTEHGQGLGTPND